VVTDTYSVWKNHDIHSEYGDKFNLYISWSKDRQINLHETLPLKKKN
jgi:hypothetical protein